MKSISVALVDVFHHWKPQTKLRRNGASSQAGQKECFLLCWQLLGKYYSAAC